MGGRDYKKGTHLGMVAMLTILIVVIVLQLYTYVKKTLHLKCVQLIVNYLCVNKAIPKVALKSYAVALVKHFYPML